MNQFIDELKNEHRKIVDLFDKIDESEKFSVKKELVRELTALVTVHLKKEDEQLYPVLASSKNEGAAKLGIIFSSAMKDNSGKFIVFVEKFLGSADLNDELSGAYKKISEKIKSRVIIEEAILYPAYESVL